MSSQHVTVAVLIALGGLVGGCSSALSSDGAQTGTVSEAVTSLSDHTATTLTAGSGTGDSCSVSPKTQAYNEAYAAAKADLGAKCDVAPGYSDAYCNDICIRAGKDSGYVAYDPASVSVASATLTRGTSCGWHEAITVTGHCTCACRY